MVYERFDSNDNHETNQQEPSSNRDEQLHQCQQELVQAKERVLYTAAEFENYRRRTEKERVTWMQTAQGSVLLDFLPILDDLERAFIQLNPEEREKAGSWLQGFELIRKAYYKLLQKYGVDEMQATGMFNPTYHEAIMEVESTAHTSGEIVSVLEKGYLYKGSVLRPAKVSVAK